MDVQKTQAQINRLEKKLKAEEHDWNAVEQYNTDKMLLDNLKAQLKDDAKQSVQLPEVAYANKAA